MEIRSIPEIARTKDVFTESGQFVVLHLDFKNVWAVGEGSSFYRLNLIVAEEKGSQGCGAILQIFLVNGSDVVALQIKSPQMLYFRQWNVTNGSEVISVQGQCVEEGVV